MTRFGLSEDEAMLRDAAARIAASRLAPLADRLDRGGGRDEFLANLDDLARQGFIALNIAADFGGAQAGTIAFAVVVEELAYACASTATTTSVTNLVGEVIQAVGSPAQRQRHLPRFADGTYRAASFCLTESGAGSDPAAMTTRARRESGSSRWSMRRRLRCCRRRRRRRRWPSPWRALRFSARLRQASAPTPRRRPPPPARSAALAA